MKKVLFGIVGLVLLLAAAVLVGPGLIDWNAYKAEIAAQAKAATGRDLTIDGDIRITVLPAPALVASDVGFANIESASAPEMIRLKSLEIRIAPGPLLGGQIEVETIRLVEPKIELEVLADGRRNWDFTIRDEASPAAAATATDPAGAKPAGTPATPAPEQETAPASAPSVRLDSFVIVNGSLVYRDAKGGTVERIDGINAEIAAASLSGPFDSAGRLVARGYPLTYEVSIGQIIHGRTVPFSLNLGLATDETKAQVAGTLVSLTEVPKFKGTVKAEGKQLAAFARAAAGAGPLPGFLAQPFSVEGAVVASAAGAEVKDLVIGLGDVKATGSVSAKLDKTPDITVQLGINRIDLDKWLAMPPARAPAPKSTGSAKGSGKTTPSPAKTKTKTGDGGAAQPAPFALPADINASLKLAAEVVTYRGEVIRQARLNAELAGGEVTISQLSTQLPGGSDVAVFGVIAADKGQPRFDGEAEISVSNLRAILGWLGTDLPRIPSGRLRRLTLAGKITATPEQLQATDLDLQVDSSRLTGGLTVALQGRPSFGADVVLDRINLDAYLPPEAAPTTEAKPAKAPAASGDAKKSPATKTSTAAEDARDAMAGWRLLQAFDANLKAHIKTLVFHQTSIKDVVFDGTLFDDKLEIRRASIAKLAGASALISGTLAGLGGIPELKNLQFEGGGRDLTRLFAMAGIEPPVPPKNLGTVAIKGRADGPLYKPVLDLSLRAAEARVGLKGTVALLPPRLDVSLTARHKDLPRLMRALGIDYRPAKRLGGLDIATNLKGDPSLLFFSDLKGTVGPVTLDGKATVGLDRPRPWFTADLNTGDIVVDRFLPAQRTSLLRLPGMPPWPQAEPAIYPVAWRTPAVHSPPSLLQVIAAKRGKKERWSRDPIDLLALHAVNADIKLKSSAVAFQKYRLVNADLALALSDGILHANRLVGDLFGGQVQGTASVRATTVPVVEAKLGLKGMDVNKAGRALTGKPLATGAMDFDVKLGATGRSVADMVSALQGNGAFALRNLDPKAGAKGTAMAAALNLVVGLNRLGGKKKKGGGLADVTGTFTVERGIARSDDLRLVSDAGDGQATGTVDLPRWLIDVAGEVRLSQNLAAQLLAAAAKADPAAQVLPFEVKGPLDAPNVKLDTSRLQGGGVKIPGVDRLLKKKGIGKVLQKLLPGQASRTQPPASTPGTLPPPPGAAPLPPPPGATALPPPPGTAAQPAPPPSATAPPPAQPKKPTPKDLLKGLLKGLGG